MHGYCLLTILRHCELISPWLIFSRVTLISNLLQSTLCLSSPRASGGLLAPATENHPVTSQGQRAEAMALVARRHGQREGYSGYRTPAPFRRRARAGEGDGGASGPLAHGMGQRLVAVTEGMPPANGDPAASTGESHGP